MMEILNTIWTALTTENEQISSFMVIPLSFLEAFISVLLFSELFNVQVNKRNKIIYILFIGFFGFINNFIIPSPYNAFLNLFAFLLSNILLLKIPFFKSLFSIVIPFIITALCESVISAAYPAIFNIDYLTASVIPLHRFTISIIIYLVMYLVYLAIKYSKINLKKLEIIDKKQKILLTINLLFGIILICTQVYVTAFYNSNLPIFIIIVHLLSLIIYFVVSIYSIFTISELETTSMKLEEAQLYNKTLQILHDNIRAFKHDFWNIVQGIGGYIGKNDMDGLKEYYAKLVEDCQQVNNLTALSPSVVNNPAIYNVLANKYHMADELGIKINLEVFMDLNELNILPSGILDFD